MAGEYVLSARLKVEGARDFEDDLQRAERSARDASDAFRKLKDVNVELNLKGVRDFEDDAMKAALAVYDLDDALEKLKAQSSSISLDGATKFLRQLDEVQLAIIRAKDYFEEFNREPLHLDQITGVEQAVADLKDLKGAADGAVKSLKALRDLEMDLHLTGADEFILDISRAEEVAQRMYRTFNQLETDPLNLGASGVAELRADLEQAEVAARGLGGALSGINTSKIRDATDETGRLHGLMDKVARGFAYSAADQMFDAIVDGARQAATEVLAFDEAITNAMSIQPQNMPLRKGFEDVARSISKELGTPVSEVAEGFYHLASAGFDAETQMESIGPVARFAKAGLTDLEDATMKGAQALAIFRPAGYSMKQVLDQLAQASNVSQGDLDSFADSLTNKAGTAAMQFGQSLEDTLGVLSAFAERGIMGKTAGEQYAIVLRDMSIRAINNRDAFREMGISVFDSQGNMRSIIDIIANLQDKFRGLSDEQTSAQLASLGFTLRSRGVILNLLEMGDRAAYFSDQMREADGVVDRMVNVQLSSLQSSLDRLKAFAIDVTISGVDTLFEFGRFLKDTFAPAIDAIAPAAAAFARGFGDALATIAKAVGAGIVVGLQTLAAVIETIGNFASQHTDAVYAFGAALAVFLTLQAASSIIGGVAAAMGTLAPVAKAAASELKILAGALSARDLSAASDSIGALVGAINPLTLILGGLAVAGGIAFLRMKEESEAAKERVDSLVESLHQAGVAAEDLGTSILAASGRIGDSGKEWDRLRDAATEAMTKLLSSELVARDAGQSFARLGVDIDTAAQALATGTDAFDTVGKLGKDALWTLEDAAKNASGPVRELAMALLEAYDNGAIGKDQLQALAKAFDETADASDDVLEKAAAYAKEQLNLATATGQLTEKELANLGIKDLSKAKTLELVTAYDNWKGAAIRAAEAHDDARFAMLKSNMDDTAEAVEGGQDALEDLEQSAEDAAKAFEALVTASNAFVQGPLTALTAGADFQEKMAAFAEATKDAGFSLDATTESGRNTINAFADLVNSGLAWAEAQAQGDPGIYAAKWNEMREALIAIIAPLVGSREEAEKLLAQFNLMPSDVPVSVKVTNDLEEAQARMREYTDADYETNVQAKADLALAQSDLAGLTSEPRTATIGAEANVAPADTSLNAVATTPRTAVIGAVADGGAANNDMDWVARPRNAPISATADGSEANRGLDYAARDRNAGIFATAATAAAENALNFAARDRVAWVTLIASYAGASEYGALPLARGGIVDYYAEGGMRENHVAQFAPAGAMRVWAEPETGGEAYIPLASSKRARSLEVWRQTGKRLGVQGFAEGGMVAQSAARVLAQSGSGGVTVTIGPGAIQANVSAAVGADPNMLADKIRDAMKPALDEFALDLTTAIRRRNG